LGASLCAVWVAHADEYGSRINLPEDAVVSADFVDSDGDSIDDRYQKGPGRPETPSRAISMPRIEYIAGAEPEGIPDIRKGVMVRAEYENVLRGAESRLKPLTHSSDRALAEMIPLVVNGDLSSKKFSFQDGMLVWVHSASEEKYLVVTQDAASTRAFSLNRE